MSVPIPTLLLKPEGSRDRSGIVTPTLTGAVRTVAGSTPGSQAWFVEEGTTNYHPNPALVSGTAGWQTFAGAGSMTGKRVATQPDMDTWVYEAEITAKDSPTTGTFYFRMPAIPTPGLTGPVTPSCLVKLSGPTTGRRVTRLTYTDGTFADTSSPLEMLAQDAQRMVFPTATVDPAKTLSNSEGHILVAGSAAAVGFRAWMGKGQVENKSYATSYCDGSQGTGYTWSGVAHASASTRTRGAITIPNAGYVTGASGEICARFRPGDANWLRSSNVYNRIFSAQGANNSLIAFATSGNRVAAAVSGQNLVWTIPDPSDMKVRNLSVTWAVSTGPQIIGDGVVRNVGTALTEPVIVGSEIGVGSASGEGATLRLESLLTFDRPLTEAERAELLAMPSWKWDRFGGRTLSYGAVA